MIQTVEQMIAQYILAWNSTQPDAFEPAFALCWAEDANYSDPNFPMVEGLTGLINLAKDALLQIGFRQFSIIMEPQSHDYTCLYKWRASFADGRSADGYDFIEFNEAFQITRLVSFY